MDEVSLSVRDEVAIRRRSEMYGEAMLWMGYMQILTPLPHPPKLPQGRTEGVLVILQAPEVRTCGSFRGLVGMQMSTLGNVTNVTLMKKIIRPKKDVRQSYRLRDSESYTTAF